MLTLSQAFGLRRIAGVVAALTAVAVVGLPAVAATALPSASLTITPLGWNEVGLDSNTPTSGPHYFEIGGKVCNTSLVDATGVTAVWAWTTSNADVTTDDPPSKDVGALAASTCRSVY